MPKEQQRDPAHSKIEFLMINVEEMFYVRENKRLQFPQQDQERQRRRIAWLLDCNKMRQTTYFYQSII